MDNKTLIILIVVAVAVVAVLGVLVLGLGNGNNDNDQYVVYHGNGGQYEGKDVVNSTTTTVLPDTLFSRDGYHCTGWNSKADGTGSDFRPDTHVALGTHLYAQWSDSSSLFTLGNFYTSKFHMVLGQAGSSDVVPIDQAGMYEIPESDALIAISWNDSDVSVEVSKNSVTFKSTTSLSKTTVTLTLDGATSEDFKILSENSAYLKFTPNSKNSTVNLDISVVSN